MCGIRCNESIHVMECVCWCWCGVHLCVCRWSHSATVHACETSCTLTQSMLVCHSLSLPSSHYRFLIRIFSAVSIILVFNSLFFSPLSVWIFLFEIASFDGFTCGYATIYIICVVTIISFVSRVQWSIHRQITRRINRRELLSIDCFIKSIVENGEFHDRINEFSCAQLACSHKL